MTPVEIDLSLCLCYNRRMSELLSSSRPLHENNPITDSEILQFAKDLDRHGDELYAEFLAEHSLAEQADHADGQTIDDIRASLPGIYSAAQNPNELDDPDF
jgi:hypothetical protein